MNENLLDKHFGEAIKDLPHKKLSWWADYRIRRMLRRRARELDGKPTWILVLPRLVALPVAAVFLLTVSGAYSFYSPNVVKGDFLYPLKSNLESAFYPDSGAPEKRMSYHLWLSERRFQEAENILVRRESPSISFRFAAFANHETHPLDSVLIETLEEGSQHVDYAILISKEVPEVSIVSQAQEKIKSAVRKQKDFLVKASPILQHVAISKKILAREKSELKNGKEMLQDRVAFQEKILDQFEKSIQKTIAQGERTFKNEDGELEEAITRIAEEDTKVHKVFEKSFVKHLEKEKKDLEKRIAQIEIPRSLIVSKEIDREKPEKRPRRDRKKEVVPVENTAEEVSATVPSETDFGEMELPLPGEIIAEEKESEAPAEIISDEKKTIVPDEIISEEGVASERKEPIDPCVKKALKECEEGDEKCQKKVLEECREEMREEENEKREKERERTQKGLEKKIEKIEKSLEKLKTKKKD